MALKIYNSLSKKLEEFKPLIETQVGLYTCGPTVYGFPHIGNYRAYIFADVLKRTLLYNNYNVHHIMNLTDVDDKTIRDSQKEGKSLKEFTEYYTDAFYKDCSLLHVLPATKYTKATNYINEMVSIIETLIAKGYAYTSDDGSVYFSIKKDIEYGKLAHLDLATLNTNASGRMKLDEYDKDNVQDFSLWKSWDETDGDVFWETSLGKGRPGWHIECSAMSMSELGESFDIHTGGIDNMFPHHENEIAQSECATGKPFVKYWMHNAWLLVDGKKMAKSAGNFYTLRDIIHRGYNPLVFRYLVLQSGYRSPLNFTWESIDAAKEAFNRLHNLYRELGEENGAVISQYREKFVTALSDDLNTPLGLGILWELLKDGSISTIDKRATFLDFDRIFGFNFQDIQEETLPDDVEKLVIKRDKARESKDWVISDSIRDELAELGYEVKDTETGTRIFKKD